jgi:hypothetical protein
MRSSMVEILCFPEGSFKVVMKKKMAFTQKNITEPVLMEGEAGTAAVHHKCEA